MMRCYDLSIFAQVKGTGEFVEKFKKIPIFLMFCISLLFDELINKSRTIRSKSLLGKYTCLCMEQIDI